MLLLTTVVSKIKKDTRDFLEIPWIYYDRPVVYNVVFYENRKICD